LNSKVLIAAQTYVQSVNRRSRRNRWSRCSFCLWTSKTTGTDTCRKTSLQSCWGNS